MELLQELQIHQMELEIQNEELRAAQQALEASRNDYFHLFNDAPVGYLALDRAGMIHHVNRTFADMIGAPPVRFVRRPFSDWVMPEDRHSFHSRFPAMFQAAGTSGLELRLVPAKAQPIWVRMESRHLETPADPPGSAC